MDFRLARPIIAREKSKALWVKLLHTLHVSSKWLCQFFTFMDLQPFCKYFMFTKTSTLGDVKYNIIYIDQYSPRKSSKVSMVQQYLPPLIRKKYIMVILHIYWDYAIFLLFCYHQDNKSGWCKIENSVAWSIF